MPSEATRPIVVLLLVAVTIGAVPVLGSVSSLSDLETASVRLDAQVTPEPADIHWFAKPSPESSMSVAVVDTQSNSNTTISNETQDSKNETSIEGGNQTVDGGNQTNDQSGNQTGGASGKQTIDNQTTETETNDETVSTTQDNSTDEQVVGNQTESGDATENETVTTDGTEEANTTNQTATATMAEGIESERTLDLSRSTTVWSLMLVWPRDNTL